MIRYIQCKRGSITVLVALMLPVLIGFAALALDVANFYVVKGRLQTAADAAALGAAQSISNPQAAQTVGVQLANLNVDAGYGPVTGVSDVVLGQYNSGTKTFAPSVQPYNAVQVTATRNVMRGNAPTWFLAQLFGAKTLDMEVKAVAAVSQGACMIALDPSSTQTFLASGLGKVMVPNCGIYVDSSDADALHQSGNGGISALDINVVGGYYTAGNYSPAPKSQRPYLVDPLASIPEPSPGPCTYFNANINGNATIPSGSVICGSTSFRGGTVTFEPGIIYFVNAQVKLSSNVNVVGKDVTIYLDGTTTWDSTGTGNVSLSAPSSGAYAGISIFGSRTGPIDVMSFTGGKNYSILGTIYLPHDIIDIAGSADAQVSSQNGYVIAWRFSYHGNSIFVFDSFGMVMPAGLSAAAVGLVK